MKRRFIHFTCILAIFIFLLTGCGSANSADAKRLKPAPDFKLQDLSQNTYILSSYKDKQQPVVLFFWTTWCPFCRGELKVLTDMYPQLSANGWELFAIDAGEAADKVDRAVKRYSLPFKVLLDKDTAVAKSFGVLGVPTYVFVDKQGNIITTEHSFPTEEYKKWVTK